MCKKGHLQIQTQVLWRPVSSKLSRVELLSLLGVFRAAQLARCVERSLAPCHHLLRHLVVVMRWSTEWEIDSHLFRQHLSATRSHRAKSGSWSPRTVGVHRHRCNSFLLYLTAPAAAIYFSKGSIIFECDVVVRLRLWFITSRLKIIFWLLFSLPSRIHFISELQRKWQYCDDVITSRTRRSGIQCTLSGQFIQESPTSNVSEGWFAHSTKSTPIL